MEFDKENFKKKYPSIADELENGNKKIKICSIKINEELNNTKKKNKGFQDYVPSIIDFIRRCNNIEEAEEIINYLEKRGEISEEYAKKIRKQIKNKGIRSFGSKKQDNYYFKDIQIK